MGAESSVQRDGDSQKDASASASASAAELSAEVSALQEGSSVIDSKLLEKNGQISSMTSLNGHSEDHTLAEVGQPDGVAQNEEAPETMDNIQGEVAPQVNGEKLEKESPDANEISAVEEKAAEVKPEDANEVGFKKIFRFVGFKFTLKKDKSEEKDPVKLLTVKDKEGEEVVGADEPTKEEETATAEKKSTTEEKEADTEASTAEAEVVEDDKAEAADVPAGDTAAEATDEAVKEEGAEKEGETTLSPFRKLFSGGLFSNLRKKASIKKPKEEEHKEAAAEETAKTEDTAAVEEKDENVEVEKETKEEAAATPEEVIVETVPEPEVSVETSAAATTDETKSEEEKAAPAAEQEKPPAEVTSEAELLSSQEKTKAQGSPLKKLFTGAGLKKLSTKKQKSKKDTEAKLTASGEQAAETQTCTESAEAPKADSGPSSPEELEEHVIAVEVTQNESSQETDGEVASDGEKKKEGIIAWSSFKKLVTPKKRVKRSSESDDEATGEKAAKSATLSSSESATLADNSVEEETKEDKTTEEEPKTENNEKLVSSTEEPKKKMDTSVSWEALMCMGGPKKRTRKTSDSDDEGTKVEEESAAAVAVEGEQEGKTEAAIVISQNTESEGEMVSSSEPLSPNPERESTWDTLKRIVMPKNKTKNEENPEETAEPVLSDSEAPKDESSFSLRKLFPGRRKKKAEKQASTEQGEDDSDTPAVVPLSEYEDQVEVEQEAPAEAAEVQVKVSSEDRAPSWIPATVEDGDDNQLSDIPEEAENAATPKSVDTDTAEDETEDKSPEAPRQAERRLSTAEVKPVLPAPSAETTPVPQRPNPENAEEVLEGIEAQINEIPPQTDVTVEDAAVEVVSEVTEFEPPTVIVTPMTNTILEPHTHDEAMAICTGLGTKEIAKIALEKPAKHIEECVAVVCDAVSTEVTVEEKPPSIEGAAVKVETLFTVQERQVEDTMLEPVVTSSQIELSDIEAASESSEPQIETVGIVSTDVEEFEIIQPTNMSENSPNGVKTVDPITPTSETAVCTQSVEVTEPAVQDKEKKMDVDQLVATEENTVKEVVQCVTAEIASAICETKPTVNVVEPNEDCVVAETVVLVAPVSVATLDMVSVENATEAVESIQVHYNKEEVLVAETLEATAAQTATTEISEQSSQNMEEIKEVVQTTGEIEAQSMVIAQSVIQDAVDNVSADAPESQNPTASTPVQAVVTTEEEITTESPVISETPVAVVCEKPAPKSPQSLNVAMEVIETIQLEVTESIDVPAEEKKTEGLKKAVEVNVSEESVVVEEVVEIKAESQTVEEPEQVKEEESKEDAEVQEADVKEAAEEVETQLEEAKSEPPSEQEQEKVLELHMPIQVVLQTAQVLEEPSLEEEVVEEFDCNGPVAEDTKAEAATENKLSTLSEEPQVTAAADVPAPSQAAEAEAPETPSGKCAEVMAQVIEVIEEAVKEIEPVSTEIIAAS